MAATHYLYLRSQTTMKSHGEKFRESCKLSKFEGCMAIRHGVAAFQRLQNKTTLRQL